MLGHVWRCVRYFAPSFTWSLSSFEKSRIPFSEICYEPSRRKSPSFLWRVRSFVTLLDVPVITKVTVHPTIYFALNTYSQRFVNSLYLVVFLHSDVLGANRRNEQCKFDLSHSLHKVQSFSLFKVSVAQIFISCNFDQLNCLRTSHFHKLCSVPFQDGWHNSMSNQRHSNLGQFPSYHSVLGYRRLWVGRTVCRDFILHLVCLLLSIALFPSRERIGRRAWKRRSCREPPRRCEACRGLLARESGLSARRSSAPPHGVVLSAPPWPACFTARSTGESPVSLDVQLSRLFSNGEGKKLSSRSAFHRDSIEPASLTNQILQYDPPVWKMRISAEIELLTKKSHPRGPVSMRDLNVNFYTAKTARVCSPEFSLHWNFFEWDSFIWRKEKFNILGTFAEHCGNATECIPKRNLCLSEISLDLLCKCQE